MRSRLRPTFPTTCGALVLAWLVSAIAQAQVIRAPQAAAATPDSFVIDFGPMVGGGSASDGATVRSVSGYLLALERPVHLGRGISIGPRLEIANTFANTRAATDTGTTLSAYDQRILSLGARLAKRLGQGETAPSLFATVVSGRGVSKLTVDESSPRAFRESLYGNIATNHLASEVGGWLPVGPGFSLSVGVLLGRDQLDLRDATGSYQGNGVRSDGSLTLTEGAHGASDGSLASTVTLRAYAMKVGLGLSF